MKPSQLPKVWCTLEAIRESLQISHQDLSELMGLRSSEYWDLRERKREPTVTSTMELSKRLNIGFDSLMLNQFDYQALKHFHQGNAEHLPEYYQVGAFSKRRTVLHLLDYVRKHFGQGSLQMILREFQLTEAVFQNPDDLINFRFAIDLGNYVYQYHPDPEVLVAMGQHSVQFNRESEVGMSLQGSRSPMGAMEKMMTELVPKYFESNYQWKIQSMSPQVMTLNGQPTADLRAFHSLKYINSSVGCMFRQGVMSVVPAFAGFSKAQVAKSQCVSQGDCACRFEIVFQ